MNCKKLTILSNVETSHPTTVVELFYKDMEKAIEAKDKLALVWTEFRDEHALEVSGDEFLLTNTDEKISIYSMVITDCTLDNDQDLSLLNKEFNITIRPDLIVNIKHA